MIIDTHAHIQLDRYDKDRDAVLARAKKAGVERIIAVGIDLETSHAAIDLAAKNSAVYATVGLHPHDSEKLSDKLLSDFRELAQKPKVVALGEMGLDFYRDLSPRKKQRQAFEKQIELAKELGLPVVVHDRDAHEDILRILRRHAGKIDCVMHCFSGDWRMAQECVDMGFQISIPGPVTYPNAKKLREVVRKIPLERLFVETDCPWLTPQFRRGKRNEPAYVRAVVEKVANLKNTSSEKVAMTTTENARRFFGISN